MKPFRNKRKPETSSPSPRRHRRLPPLGPWAEAGSKNDIALDPTEIRTFAESAVWLALRQQIGRTLTLAYSRLKERQEPEVLYFEQGMIRGLEWVLDAPERLLQAAEPRDETPETGDRDTVRELLGPGIPPCDTPHL